MAERYFLRQTEDGDLVIKEELLTTKAEEWASKFVGNDPRRPEVKSSQLRKFYNEVKALAKKAEGQKKAQKIKPLVKMLKVKVNYQKGRQLVPDSFVKFISECVDKVDDKNDFDAFVKHFEAVVGYYYGKAERFD